LYRCDRKGFKGGGVCGSAVIIRVRFMCRTQITHLWSSDTDYINNLYCDTVVIVLVTSISLTPLFSKVTRWLITQPISLIRFLLVAQNFTTAMSSLIC